MTKLLAMTSRDEDFYRGFLAVLKWYGYHNATGLARQRYNNAHPAPENTTWKRQMQSLVMDMANLYFLGLQDDDMRYVPKAPITYRSSQPYEKLPFDVAGLDGVSHTHKHAMATGLVVNLLSKIYAWNGTTHKVTVSPIKTLAAIATQKANISPEGQDLAEIHRTFFASGAFMANNELRSHLAKGTAPVDHLRKLMQLLPLKRTPSEVTVYEDKLDKGADQNPNMRYNVATINADSSLAPLTINPKDFYAYDREVEFKLDVKASDGAYKPLADKNAVSINKVCHEIETHLIEFAYDLYNEKVKDLGSNALNASDAKRFKEVHHAVNERFNDFLKTDPASLVARERFIQTVQSDTKKATRAEAFAEFLNQIVIGAGESTVKTQRLDQIYYKEPLQSAVVSIREFAARLVQPAQKAEQRLRDSGWTKYFDVAAGGDVTKKADKRSLGQLAYASGSWTVTGLASMLRSISGLVVDTRQGQSGFGKTADLPKAVTFESGRIVEPPKM